MKKFLDTSVFMRVKDNQTGEVCRPKINNFGAVIAEAGVIGGICFLGAAVAHGAVCVWNKIADRVNSKNA